MTIEPRLLAVTFLLALLLVAGPGPVGVLAVAAALLVVAAPKPAPVRAERL